VLAGLRLNKVYNGMTQKKHILSINVVLLAISIGLSWKLSRDWRASANRQLETSTSAAAETANFNLPPEPLPTGAGGLVVAENLFSKDRNNEVTLPAAAPAAPPPPLPVVVGTMRLGSSYEALMAENAQNASAAFKQVKTGATVGGYKIAEIRDDEVVVEFNGEKTTINVYLSASGVARNSGRSAGPETAAAPPTQPRVDSSTAPAASGNSQSVAASAPAPVQLPSPDPLLKITVEGNRRRYERTTMFGPQIWYEDIK
jgi:hypothetical protein